MNPEFYPISYWIPCEGMYVRDEDSFTFLSYALANEENQ